MLNYIWLGLIVLAVIIGGCTDKLKAVADASFEMAKFAVLDTALPLIGIMGLWLGIMRLAERAGLVTLLARALRPVMRWLFPEVPAEHPAMGSMLMNIAANMLGLGNAATPLGLRAMKDLDALNPHPGTATNAMCTFLAINTSSVQLIPVTAIAILAANRSSNPTAIVGTSIMATACAAVAAVGMAKMLGRLPMFRVRESSDAVAAGSERGSNLSKASSPRPSPPVEERESAGGTEGISQPDRAVSESAEPKGLSKSFTPSPPQEERVGERRPLPTALTEPPLVPESGELRPFAWCGRLVLSAFGLFFIYLFLRHAFPEMLGLTLLPDAPKQTLFIRVVDAISKISIPFVLSFFPLYAALRRVKVYEEFVEGAKEGFQVAIRIIPFLVAILVAIGMFRAAGGIALLSKALGPAMLAVGFPPDLLPLALMRPLSGGGTLAVFTELVNHVGPDSLVARTAGTIYGSTETTFYVLAVYFGSVGIKRTRYAVLAGLTADLVGVVASVIICRLVFG